MAEPTTHNAERGYPMAAIAASTRLLFFGAKTNVRQHNSQNVCSYLLNTSAVVLLYAEDAAPNRIDTKSLGPMCVLQARAKAQTAMSHEFECVDVGGMERNQFRDPSWESKKRRWE